MSGRWAVIREAFDIAADADGATRHRVLASLAADPSTRDEVAALLEAHDRRTLLEEQPELQRVGPFLLRERLGSGGFGDVYRGEQSSPVVREAAVKVLHGTHRAREVLARFSLEQHTLARLDHPCIARLYEAGVSGEEAGEGGPGRPWFAMQLVRGERIDRWATGASARQITVLMADVAEAVHHAHQRGIIHRDIKPSNILVETGDEGPAARLIDFGVAKAVSTEEGSGVTVERVQVGTPAYMSPEQREGSVVDVRTDVFALGAVLYDLLSGGADGEPVPDRAVGLADARAWSGEARLVRALEPVTRKAMAVSAPDRYTSAAEFAQDLRAVLRGEPTSIGTPTLMERTRWSVRRHPAAWGAAALLGVALLGGAIGAGYGLVRAQQERDIARTAAANAERQQASAEAALQILEETLTGIDPDVAHGRDASLLLDRARSALARLDAGALSRQPEAEVRLRALIGNAMMKLGRAAEGEEITSRAMALARERLAPSHLTAREARTAWINCLVELGRYAEALAVVEIAAKGAAPPGAEAADREKLVAIYERQNWSRVFLLTGDTSRARLYNHEAAVLIPSLDEPNANAESQALLQAAHIASAAGDNTAAVEYAGRALAALERAFRPGHPAIARAHNNLGTYLEEVGRTGEALSHKQAALTMARELYPHADGRIALALDNMAVTLAKLGREAEAGAAMDESLVMFRILHAGKDHPDLARALDHCAVRHAVAGDLSEAEKLVREGLAMRQRLAPGSDGVASSLVTLARVLAVSSRIDQAEPYFAEALQIRRTLAEGKDHYEVAKSMAVHGEVLQDAGRAGNAEPLLREAVEMGLRLFPLEKGVHPEVALWAGTLVDCLRAQGKTEEADALIRRFKAAR